MAKKTLICLSTIIVLSVILWNIPIRSSLKEGKFEIENFASSDSVAIVCKGTQSTGPYWNILDCSDDSVLQWEDKSCNTIGNDPGKSLRFPEYYYDAKFVLVGNFVEDEIAAYGTAHMFNVEEWYILDPIKRRFLILPYPKYGLNFIELK